MPASTRRSSISVHGKSSDQPVRMSHESISLLASVRAPGRPRSSSDAVSMEGVTPCVPIGEAQPKATTSPPILSAHNWVKDGDRRKSVSRQGKENRSGKVTRALCAEMSQALNNDGEGENGRIMVYVRLRPMSVKEKDAGAQPCVRMEKQDVYITEFAQETDYLRLKRLRERNFTFDAAFSEHASQQDVYNTSTAKLVEAVVQGKNCSVFCYGATGAGKTYTMLGSVENPGVMVLALTYLFTRLEQQSEFTVRLSYLEVYNETLRDLLCPDQTLVLREDTKQGITASGLTHYVAKSAEEVMALLQKGNQNRQTEPTRMNETSSRSHAILQVVAEHRIRTDIGYVNRAGKLSLIDLAGSERALATDCKTARSLEGANINRSLLALSSCINALVEGKKHIPFRNSKLTQLLKDSLGGSCQTAMIANVSPSSLQFGETQNTLHWASRAKKIRTKQACINEELQIPGSKHEQALLLLQMQKENRELKLEIARLQQERASEKAAAPDPSTSPSYMQSVIRSSLDKGGDPERTISELRKALLFLESGVKKKTDTEDLKEQEQDAGASHKKTPPPRRRRPKTGRKMRMESMDENDMTSLLVTGRPLTRLLEKKIKEEQLRRMSSLTELRAPWSPPGSSRKRSLVLESERQSSAIKCFKRQACSPSSLLLQESEGVGGWGLAWLGLAWLGWIVKAKPAFEWSHKREKHLIAQIRY